MPCAAFGVGSSEDPAGEADLGLVGGFILEHVDPNDSSIATGCKHICATYIVAVLVRNSLPVPVAKSPIAIVSQAFLSWPSPSTHEQRLYSRGCGVHLIHHPFRQLNIAPGGGAKVYAPIGYSRT